MGQGSKAIEVAPREDVAVCKPPGIHAMRVLPVEQGHFQQGQIGPAVCNLLQQSLKELAARKDCEWNSDTDLASDG